MNPMTADPGITKKIWYRSACSISDLSPNDFVSVFSYCKLRQAAANPTNQKTRLTDGFNPPSKKRTPIAPIRKKLKQTGERNFAEGAFSRADKHRSKVMKIRITATCPKSTPMVNPRSSATKEGDSGFRLETPAKPKP